MVNPLDAGQIKLNKVALITSSGVNTNVLEHIVEIEINEDIDKHVMVGRIKMNEYLNLIEALPIIGEEFVTIDYEVLGEEDSQRILDFRVTHVKDISKPKDKQFAYELVIVSAEYYINNQLSIDVAATKKVEVMISDILTQYTNTNKKFRAEATRSVQHIVFPGMSLRDAIKYCTFRAEGVSYPDSLFKFWESASGFNFYSLGHMINRAPTLNINYLQQHLSSKGDVNLATFTALSYQVLTKNDTASALVNGGYRNSLLAFDPMLKKYKYKELDYFDDFDQLGNVDPLKTNTSYFKQLVGQQGSIDYALISNLRSKPREKSIDDNVVDLYPEGYSSYFLKRQMTRARFNDLVVNITMPITHFIEAGDKIVFNVPSDSGAGDGSANDLYISGNYIVTGLKHVFTQEKGVSMLTAKKSGFQNKIARKD
jgi:uncharacterized protein YqkB